MSEVVSRTVSRAAGAASARAPRVLLSPFTNTTNPYIELQKALLADIGYDVRPMSIKSLMRGGFLDLFRPSTLLVFHWIELRAFSKGGKEVLPSPRGLVVFAFYCLLMCVGRARTVYFVHDHAVHNTRGKVRKFSMRLMSMVRRLADFRVVHAPNFEAQYNARYLPHPLYWDLPGRKPEAGADRRPERARPAFALLGAIQPYKEIASVLEVWPHDFELEIAGRGNPAYVETLHGIVAERALGDVVTIDARMLSDEEFEQRIAAADVLILPHAADSMLVSGAFFEAIGRVPVIIARSVPFMTWAAQQFGNVLLFDSVDELPRLVETVARQWPAIAKEAKAANEALRAIDAFGWNACRRRYQQFFGDIVARSGER